MTLSVLYVCPTTRVRALQNLAVGWLTLKSNDKLKVYVRGTSVANVIHAAVLSTHCDSCYTLPQQISCEAIVLFFSLQYYYVFCCCCFDNRLVVWMRLRTVTSINSFVRFVFFFKQKTDPFISDRIRREVKTRLHAAAVRKPNRKSIINNKSIIFDSSVDFKVRTQFFYTAKRNIDK